MRSWRSVWIKRGIIANFARVVGRTIINRPFWRFCGHHNHSEILELNFIKRSYRPDNSSFLPSISSSLS
ncbi:hypothetical protein [Moraxella lacunata]|uniref:hypothetical protein n=1 Tax=Moraxella lacunata TaxID=477 RepID=UPI003EDF388C